MGLAGGGKLGLMIFHALTNPPFARLNVFADSFPIGLAISMPCFLILYPSLANRAQFAFVGLQTSHFLALILRDGSAEFQRIGLAGAFPSRKRGGEREQRDK